ncbi:MAG: T9SS type A sorting domain-containing protein, partial [Bacteroidota bacterium]
SDFVNDNDAGARIQARRTVKRAGCSLRRRRRATGGRGESDGEVYDLVAYRETDENGRVTFTDLPDGYYRLNIEYPGIPMDPTSFVEFQIGDGGLEQNSLTLEATVDETGIEVELVEILKIMGSYFEDVSIYPNPASKDLNVAYAGLTRDGVVMQMLDLQGRLFKEEELVRSQDNVMTMDVSDLNPGLYLLRFIDPTNDEGIIVFKVQIKR